ncbi:hypothetical protein V1264_006702 [Littorina saxatilis]|uniref:Uncharacterized protein n=1 Tax=Littorina saxatilis TaxID=31220 RepID=A0AAN9AYH2_9CAEN
MASSEQRPAPRGHLLSQEQHMCRPPRAYIREIPPPGSNTRFQVASPVRKHSFFELKPPVPRALLAPARRKEPLPPLLSKTKKTTPKLLRSIAYQEHLRDVMHRVMSTTYSYKVKYPALQKPKDMYTCCPR